MSLIPFRHELGKEISHTPLTYEAGVMLATVCDTSPKDRSGWQLFRCGTMSIIQDLIIAFQEN